MVARKTHFMCLLGRVLIKSRLDSNFLFRPLPHTQSVLGIKARCRACFGARKVHINPIPQGCANLHTSNLDVTAKIIF